jgi:hypothetical protein
MGIKKEGKGKDPNALNFLHDTDCKPVERECVGI